MNEDPLFGHSLALAEGDIVLTGNSLQQVQGKANLLQALNLRVQTPMGSDILNTTYGLALKDALAQPGTASQVQEYIKLCLVQTLSTDLRVHGISDIIFSDDPRYPAENPPMDLDALRRKRLWKVQVVIDTLDAQTATLSLNIGV